jgi:RNA polymerase sigma-70 factor (ECF subfamily)
MDEPLGADVLRVLVHNQRAFLDFLERRLGDRALAQDFLQEAYVRGIDKAHTLEAEESAIAWFYRVLRNAATDHQRRRATTHRKLEAFATELEGSAPAVETHAVVCRCVGELAGTLKQEYADALKRVEVDGLSVKDYAAESGITSNNAAVRVFRAREALRKRLFSCCGVCAEHGCLECTCRRE